MGLGLLGRSLGVAKFLAECGARLLVTDLKTKEELASSVRELEVFPNVKFALGGHRLEDFQNCDMVIKAAGVPLENKYINEARKNSIPVEMDVSLFAKLAPEVVIVGVTGTRGKTMTTVLTYEILKKGLNHPKGAVGQNTLSSKIFLGGNIRGVATLPMLKEVKPGDVLVAELDSWQLQGFGEARISPHVAVFTSFMEDHMNYYKDDMDAYFADKANIFKYQNQDDFLVVRPGVEGLVKDSQSKIMVADVESVKDFEFIVPGEYQRENMSAAVEVARIFGIEEEKIKQAVKEFKGVEGRLQFVKEVKGIKIYNDNNATTPQATVGAINSLKDAGEVIVIAGGADKALPIDELADSLDKNCKAVILIPGSGTDKLRDLEVENYKVTDLNEAVVKAMSLAEPGDILLFSPAFSSFSQFANEYERNDLFVKLISEI